MGIPKQYIPWIGVAVFCLGLITYYIYFLDVNECIVESDSSLEGDSIAHPPSLYFPPNSTSTHNITFLCPPPNITEICANIPLSCPQQPIGDKKPSSESIGDEEEGQDGSQQPPGGQKASSESIEDEDGPQQPGDQKASSEASRESIEDGDEEDVLCPPPDLDALCTNYTQQEIPELLITDACPPASKKEYVVPGVAVLIEPRSHPSIKNVTLNIMDNLPKHWVIQIFTSKNSSEYVKSQFSKYIKTGKITVDDSVLGNTTSLRRETYNNFLVQEALWKQFLAEKVLIYQIDSVICKDSRRDITSFLQYDYIGAPWKNTTWAQVSNGVGNGGFSLRSRSKSIQAIQKYDRAGLNEDGFFARAMVKLGANMPSYQEAMQFSVERVFYPTPFGVHRFGYKRFTKEEKEQLLEYCPEINLMGM